MVVIEADQEMVNSAMARLRTKVNLLVVAQQQNLVDLFSNMVRQTLWLSHLPRTLAFYIF